MPGRLGGGVNTTKCSRVPLKESLGWFWCRGLLGGLCVGKGDIVSGDSVGQEGCGCEEEKGES